MLARARLVWASGTVSAADRGIGAGQTHQMLVSRRSAAWFRTVWAAAETGEKMQEEKTENPNTQEGQWNGGEAHAPETLPVQTREQEAHSSLTVELLAGGGLPRPPFNSPLALFPEAKAGLEAELSTASSPFCFL